MADAAKIKDRLRAQIKEIEQSDAEAAAAAPLAEAKPPAKAKPRGLKAMLEDADQQAEIRKAIPTSMTPERFSRLMLTAVHSNKQLLECDTTSLLAAGMQCAQLGLEPNTPLGHAWISPSWDRNEERYKAGLTIGYKGYIDLMLRGGRVLSIKAREVCANDEWDWADGLNERLHHKAAMSDRGDVICYWVLARLPGGHYWDVISPERIEERRLESPDPNSWFWTSRFQQMALKTCVRIATPWLPLSPQAATAMAVDETSPDYEAVVRNAEFIDVQGTEVASTPSPLDTVCDTCGVDNGHEKGCPAATPDPS